MDESEWNTQHNLITLSATRDKKVLPKECSTLDTISEISFSFTKCNIWLKAEYGLK